MNDNYEIIESIINQGSIEALNNLIAKLNLNSGTHSQEFSCGENVFYALKRLCGAALARDLKIKYNAYNSLTQLKAQVPNLSTIKPSAFAEFFLTSTDMADCKTKQQKNTYIQGKINIVKVMSEYLSGDQKVIAHFVTLATDAESLQEDLIEVLYTLTGQKFSQLKLQTTALNAKFLIKILTKKAASQSDIEEMLKNAISEYPKESIALKHLGLNFEHIVTSPQQFFKSNYAQFINTADQETEDGDLKKLYYLLQVQKYFLSNVVINQENISKFLCPEMVVAWLQQIRVKNKHMRRLASSIKITFDSDAEFSFHVLKYLHEQKMYLQNISANHPFASLYRNVEPSKFWSYMVELIKQENKKEEMTDEEDEQVKSKKEQYLSQLEYITRENVEVLTTEQVGETLTILIKALQASKKSEKLLNLVWSLFHKLLERSQKKKSKKKIVLNTKGALILSKVKLTELELESEILQTISKAIKFIRIKVKANKDSEDKVVMSFLNFVTGLIIYCIVYPEEADVCAQIEFIFKDLEALLAKELGAQSEQDTLKKKRKKSQQVTEDPKKAVHVLIEVFISLLTKAPIFLRTSINLLFEQFVPFIQTSDLDTLLDVIQKPDQDYIEEI